MSKVAKCTSFRPLSWHIAESCSASPHTRFRLLLLFYVLLYLVMWGGSKQRAWRGKVSEREREREREIGKRGHSNNMHRQRSHILFVQYFQKMYWTLKLIIEERKLFLRISLKVAQNNTKLMTRSYCCNYGWLQRLPKPYSDISCLQISHV